MDFVTGILKTPSAIAIFLCLSSAVIHQFQAMPNGIFVIATLM
jgi:hypothetical protein